VSNEAVVVRVAGMDFGVMSSTHGTSPATFVLIHGIGTSHRYMARLHDRLTAHGAVYSIDLPGFGGMPKPALSVSLAVMARALGDLLIKLGIDQSVLIGHSMGSQWVVELAAQSPALASSVVLIGPVTDDEHRSVIAQSVALGRDILGEPLDANVSVLVDYLRCGPVWYTGQLRQMLAYPIEQRVAALIVPVLVVRGGNDPIAGLAWCRRLRDSAQAGTLVVIPGHRHVVQFTAPRAVASAIRAYLPANAGVVST
jgi:pimeloyl-ACP methyl ester carboxylesterase